MARTDSLSDQLLKNAIAAKSKAQAVKEMFSGSPQYGQAANELWGGSAAINRSSQAPQAYSRGTPTIPMVPGAAMTVPDSGNEDRSALFQAAGRQALQGMQEADNSFESFQQLRAINDQNRDNILGLYQQGRMQELARQAAKKGAQASVLGAVIDTAGSVASIGNSAGWWGPKK